MNGQSRFSWIVWGIGFFREFKFSWPQKFEKESGECNKTRAKNVPETLNCKFITMFINI